MAEHKPHAVFAKSIWSGEWARVPYLYANTLTFASGPNVNQATLQYKFGKIQRPDKHSAIVYPPLYLNNSYILVMVDGGPTWTGVCVDSDIDRQGIKSARTGMQFFKCRGLEYFLQRTIVDSSWVQGPNGEVPEFPVDRAIGFNLGAGLPNSADREGNRSIAVGNRGQFIFAHTLQGAQEWTADQILNYLFKYHPPANQTGQDLLGWGAIGNISLLQSYKPCLQVHGKTLFQILNELVDRRRLMGWYMDYDENKPKIRIFTFNKTPVILPGGGQIAPNTNVAAWNFDTSNLAQTLVLSTDDSGMYHRVISRGEPQGGVFTTGVINGSLEPDWTPAQQATYRLGASATAGYGAMDDWAKHDANQQARSKDSLKKVFRYFRIPPAFNGAINGHPVWPISKAKTNVGRNSWWPGIRLQDKLPLRLEHDYQNPVAVTNAMKQNSKWEYQRPFAFVQENGKRAYFLDRMSRGESVGTHIEASGRFWAASLRMQDDACGIIIDVGGAPQHMIAKSTFTPIDDVDATDYEPDVDYSYFWATLFAECDGHVEEQWPPPEQLAVGTEVLRELIIPVPDACLHYIVPGTVLDIGADGTPVICVNGGFVRDDTKFLKDVARSAYEWYATPRRSVRLIRHSLERLAPIGQLITTIGTELLMVNSVVTDASYDLLKGTATYTTQFAEMDLAHEKA